MKKRILAMLLSALLAANFSACSQTPNNIPENKTEGSVESIVESTTETEKSNNELPNQNETVRDVPGIGKLKLCSYYDNSTKASVWFSDEKKEHYIYINEMDTYSPLDELSTYDFYWYLYDESTNETVRDVPGLGELKLFRAFNASTKASIWWSDEKEEFYIYINDWDAYRPMRGLLNLNDNCIAIDNEATTVSLVYQEGKHHEPIIVTYRFSRSNELVEVHAVPLNIIASSEYDTYFGIMHDVNHGYYFLTPSMDGDPDWRMDGVRGWPLFMFETTDGGKSWNQISTNTFSPGASDHINILKFVSPQIGIISFRDLGECEVWERTYLTVDGGLTWTQMSELPRSDMKDWYSEIIDLEYVKDYDYYRLTVEASNRGPDFQIQFWSKDLINWTLIDD